MEKQYLFARSFLILIIPFLFITIFTGCNAPIMHKWQMDGNDRYVRLNTADWPIVSQSLYVAIPEDQIIDAESLLQEKDFIELSEAQEKTFIGNFNKPSDPNLKPYLIRGVTMGTPWFSILRRNDSTNEIVIYRATWNGEITIPFVKPKFGIWPIVIYLDASPMRIYPTAAYGGDWIMYGHDWNTLDKRIIERKGRTTNKANSADAKSSAVD
jgi:hypothetical protein